MDCSESYQKNTGAKILCNICYMYWNDHIKTRLDVRNESQHHITFKIGILKICPFHRICVCGVIIKAYFDRRGSSDWLDER